MSDDGWSLLELFIAVINLRNTEFLLQAREELLVIVSASLYE